jgi:hypothetical protein
VGRADNLTTFMCRLSRNLGASISWNPQGLYSPVMGLLYLFLLLSLLFDVTFMQRIYSYMPDTNLVYTIFYVASTRCLQFMVHIMLFYVIGVVYFVIIIIIIIIIIIYCSVSRIFQVHDVYSQ